MEVVSREDVLRLFLLVRKLREFWLRVWNLECRLRILERKKVC